MVTGWRKVAVPAQLHREIKVAAAQDDRLIGDVVTEALVAWLEARRTQLDAGWPCKNSRHGEHCHHAGCMPAAPGRDAEVPA
jgi:hypothetical protein